MSALYPNVPIAQGVPAVLRNAIDTSDAVALVQDAGDGSVSPDDWGIFDASGTRVLMPDNIVAIERGAEYRISDYPVEQGGFQSYNKVATPFEVRLTLTKGGSVSDRTAFLNALSAIEASLDLYSVSTPEHVYVGVNVTRASQSRTAQSGAGMVIVEVLLQEVRETVSVAYTTAVTDAPPPISDAPTPKPVAKLTPSTVKQPTAAAPANQGSVQAKPVTVPGAKLVTSSSGRQLYVYDKPIGTVR